jgi:hypothetical protein
MTARKQILHPKVLGCDITYLITEQAPMIGQMMHHGIDGLIVYSQDYAWQMHPSVRDIVMMACMGRHRPIIIPCMHDAPSSYFTHAAVSMGAGRIHAMDITKPFPTSLSACCSRIAASMQRTHQELFS